MAESDSRVTRILRDHVIWDNHACMPIKPNNTSFLPQLERHRRAGANLVSLNVTYDKFVPETAFAMLATLRHWLLERPDDYVLVDTVDDILAAKANDKLAVMFDIEGGRAVESHPGLVEIFYRLGVRWMLIAYNKNNRLGGGCQDEDSGLTDFGREIIEAMERVGMVVCCSHTGYRTARETLDYARNPVIFSHSNPRAVWNHERNIPDDLIIACARKGGVISINGIAIFLGDNDNSTDTFVRHIDHVVQLVGAAHVGIGLDYVFDQAALNEAVRNRPDLFPPEKGYILDGKFVEPERIPEIAGALVRLGYSDADIAGILGENNFRVAAQVWK